MPGLLTLFQEKFNDLVQPALFASRLLDSYDCSHMGLLWHLESPPSACKRLWDAYLLYRTKNETDPAVGNFCDIRRMAGLVAAENESSGPKKTNSVGDTILERLCWLALVKKTSNGTRSPLCSSDLLVTDASLLSAAAHFNMVALAERLLQEGASPVDDGQIFPSAIEVAACAGNKNMLEILSRNLDRKTQLMEGEGEGEGEPIPLGRTPDWLTSAGRRAMEAAAARGDVEFLKLVRRHVANGCGLDLCSEIMGDVVLYAMWNTANPETYDYLATLYTSQTAHVLVHYAAHGQLAMVRHLVERVGFAVDGLSWDKARHGNPLANACRRGHDDVVDYLLARGAKIDHSEEDDRDSALPAAASGGSLAMVRKLVLDHGAPLDTIPALQAILEAVKLEHTEMVHFLLDRCDFPHPAEDYLQHIRGPHVAFAKSEGLDSMVELLEAWSEANPPVEVYL